MGKSKLESLSDRILSQFFIQLRKIYDDDLKNSSHYSLVEQDNFIDACDTVSNIFGVAPCDYIDLDFIITMIDMNPSIGEGIINKRPTIGNYTYEIDINEKVYERATYRHKSESYSPSTLIQIAKKMEYEGDISVWDGQEIDRENYDSETISINYDKNSITKIR